MKKFFLLLMQACVFISMGCKKDNTTQGNVPSPAVTPTVSISVSKSSISPGEVITVTWSSSVAGAEISGMGTMNGTSGSFTISPSAPTTLVITATDRGKTGTAQTSIGIPDFDNLTAAPWKLWSIAALSSGTNHWDSLVGNQIVACQLDDLNYFYPDKRTKTTYGAIHCDPGETDLPGGWDFITGQLMWGHLFRYTVDGSRLVVEYTDLYGNVYRTTFIH